MVFPDEATCPFKELFFEALSTELKSISPLQFPPPPPPPPTWAKKQKPSDASFRLSQLRGEGGLDHGRGTDLGLGPGAH